jgi:hypothetical protein
MERHACLLDRAFSFWPADRRAGAFARLWGMARPAHAALAALAADPRAGDARGPAPGQPCPLCGMPTFEWAGPDDVRRVDSLVRAEFAGWSVGQGACARCAEVYAAVGSSREGLAALRESRRS